MLRLRFTPLSMTGGGGASRHPTNRRLSALICGCIWEIQDGEFAAMLLGDAVIRLGRFDLVAVAAKRLGPSVNV